MKVNKETLTLNKTYKKERKRERKLEIFLLKNYKAVENALIYNFPQRQTLEPLTLTELMPYIHFVLNLIHLVTDKLISFQFHFCKSIKFLSMLCIFILIYNLKRYYI